MESRLTEFGSAIYASFRGIDTPHQLALGTAFGIAMGIIPKDSLFFYLLGLLLLLTNANLLCAALGCVATSLIGVAADPWLHEAGFYVLSLDRMEATWCWLAGLPLMPWTNFNNTVVMGSVIAGAIAFLPTYLVSRWMFSRFGPRMFDRIRTSHFFRWLIGSPRNQYQEV